jgi:hypothetical protein
MANPTDTEVRELKDLIIANNTALTNSIASLSQRMEVGFAEVKGEMKALDQRIASVDQKVVALDDRLKNQDIGRGILLFKLTIFVGLASMTS